MLKCAKCGRYTLSDECVLCKTKAREVHPQKFSVSDRFGKYRRMAKAEMHGNDNKRD